MALLGLEGWACATLGRWSFELIGCGVCSLRTKYSCILRNCPEDRGGHGCGRTDRHPDCGLAPVDLACAIVGPRSFEPLAVATLAVIGVEMMVDSKVVACTEVQGVSFLCLEDLEPLAFASEAICRARLVVDSEVPAFTEVHERGY